MRNFPGFRAQALRFQRQLKRNNRREWFLEHREEYDAEVLGPLRLFVEEMDVRLATLAPEIVGDPKKAVFRIYRDVRFSKDKSPYKTHAACWFQHRGAGRGVGSETHGAGAGFYFHLEPGHSLVAGGIWMPPRESLALLRDAVAARTGLFTATLAGRAFKKRFGSLNTEGRLTRVPRGYDPAHPAGEWLRQVSFTVSAPLTDEQVTSPRLPELVARDYKLMLPLVRWLNDVLGFPPRSSR
jgi:uncharacterized protein (TIGR02453 family)